MIGKHNRPNWKLIGQSYAKLQLGLCDLINYAIN